MFRISVGLGITAGNGFTTQNAGDVPVNVVAPTLMGALVEGQTIGVNVGIWNPTGTFSYQWDLDGIPQVGATNSTFALTNAMLGKIPNCTVGCTGATTVYAHTTNTTSVASMAPPPVVPAWATNPKILGDYNAFAILTIDYGSYVGQPIPDTSVQWTRDGADIAGENGDTYLIAFSDIGTTIGARVELDSTAGHAEITLPGEVVTFAEDAFFNVSLPFYTGTETEGQVLAANIGTWQPVPQAVAYDWYRDGVLIPNTDVALYLLVAADVGAQMSVRITASYQGVTKQATSLPGGVIKAAAPPETVPENSVKPSITGNAVVDSTLHGIIGTWTGYPAPEFTYQWKADGVDISGATDIDYVLTTDELGKVITFQVTGTNSEGSDVGISDPTSAVQNIAATGFAGLFLNIGGMETGDAWAGFTITVPQSSIAAKVAKGIKKFRVTVDGSKAQPTPLGALDLNYMGAIKNLADYCATLGAQIVIDLHDFGGRTIQQVTSTQVFTDDFFADGWTVWQGSLRFDGLVENTANNTHNINRSYTAVQGVQVVESEVKAGTKPWLRITARTGTDHSALVDLTTGTVIPNPAAAATLAIDVTPTDSGYYLVTLRTPVIAAGSVQILYEPGNATGDYASFVSTGRIYTGDGVSQPFYIRECTVSTEVTAKKGVNYGSAELPFTVLYDWWFQVSTWCLENITSGGVYAMEIMNEPYVWSTDQAFNGYKAGMLGCRDAGWTGPIYIGGIPWQNGPTFWQLNPNLHLLPDPLNNLIFSAHGYADRDSSGTHFGLDEWGQLRAEGPPGAVTDVNVLIDRYRPFIEGCEARGVRASVGECGIDMTGGAISIECFQKTLDYMDAHNCHWYVWAAGPVWPAAYPYSQEDRNNGMQSPGMVVFDDYYDNPAPTKYSCEGPSRLAEGETTALIEITYNGRLLVAEDITLSDNGGGGTFTPPVVTLAPGANSYGTSVYTPNGEQLVRISSTSESGWTDVTGGFDFSSERDMLDDINSTNYFTAENILDWQVQRIATHKGPIAQVARDSDQTTMDIVPVGQGYNTANVGLEPDWAAVVTWAGGPFRLKYVYNQAASGARNIGPATNESRVPVHTELPIMVQDNGGKWYPSFTTATRMRLDSLMGVKGHVISFTTKYTSGSALIQWGFTNTVKNVMPGISQTWIANQNVVAPTNTVPNERGDMPFGVLDGEWHVYTERWVGAPSSSTERLEGWKTWRDTELIGLQDTGAVSLNVDYQRNDATMGFNRFNQSIGLYTGLVGPIYIFRDTTSGAPDMPDEDAVQALIEQQMDDHSIGPVDFDDFSHIQLNFEAGTYKVDGSDVTLTDVLTGTHSINSDGLLVNSGTAAKNAAGALLTALQSKEFVIRIKTKSVSGAGNLDSFKLITFTLASGTATWQVNRASVQVMTGMGSTGGSNRYTVRAPKILQISQSLNKQIHCQAPTTPIESAYVTTSNITAAAFFSGINAAWGDIRIASIEVSATPFKSGWQFIETMRDDYIGAPGPVNPNDLRLGVNLGTFLNFTNGDPNWVYDYYVSKRAKTFRLTLNWDGDAATGKPGMQVTPSGPLNTAYIDKIAAATNYALGLGAEVILDCHEFGAGLNTPDHRTTADLVDLWSKLTAAMPKSPRVGYCIMNEPVGTILDAPGGAQVSKTSYTTQIEQPVINAIRAAGGVGPIHVSIQGTYTAASSAADYADDKLLLTDPLNNLVLEVHEYYSSDGGGGDNNAVKYKATAQAVNVIKWAKDHGWTLFWGECGMGNSLGGGTLSFTHAQEVASFYKLVSKYKDVVRGVAAWTGGRLQSVDTYIYSHDPRYVPASSTSPWPQPKGNKMNVAALMAKAAPADLSGQPPYNRVQPSISGSLIEGQVLTCNPGQWDRAEGFLYLWLRDDVAIVPNVTSQTYLLVNADVAKKISCRVTATNVVNGNTVTKTQQTGNINPAAAPSVPNFEIPPSLVADGELVAGTVITLTDGLISGFPTPTLSRTWYRNGAVVPSLQDLTTYTLAAVDNGKTLNVTIDATNSQGTVQGTSNTLIIPDPAAGVVTLTKGTLRNVSGLAGNTNAAWELTAASDPTNQARRVIVGRLQVWSNSVIFYTADGGASWTAQVIIGESEPTVWCDHLGNFWITTSGSNDFRIRNIAVGASTVGTVKVIGGYLDRTHIHVDTGALSPFRGRIYCGGRTGSAGGMRVWRSDDGVTFTASTTTVDDGFNKGFLYGITTGPDGVVYATWLGMNNSINGPSGYQGSNQNFYVVRSRDGGITWTAVFIYKDQETLATGSGTGYRSWASNIAVNPVTGRLHIVISQGAPGLPQQKRYLTSDDQGDTWDDKGFLNLGLPSGWGPGHHGLSCNYLGQLMLQFYAVNSSYTLTRMYAIGTKNDGISWGGLLKVNTTDSAMVSSDPWKFIGEDRTYGCANPDGSFLVPYDSNIAGNNTYAAYVCNITLS